MSRFIPAYNILLGVLLNLLSVTVFCAEAPVIAAAASLKPALEEIAAHFHRDTAGTVKLAFGSSGNLYRQIVQGAPFEIFFSADEDSVLKLAQAGKTLDQGMLYATGRIVLFAPRGAKLSVDERGDGLRAALLEGQGRIRRFAIANPEHAPYGRAAREALQSLGLWEMIKPRLVLGENVSQAAQFASSGSAQGGIFAYSLALAPGVKTRGQFVLLPEHLHAPLRQRMALIKNAGETARHFYSYVQQAPARIILERYGFTAPAPGG